MSQLKLKASWPFFQLFVACRLSVGYRMPAGKEGRWTRIIIYDNSPFWGSFCLCTKLHFYLIYNIDKKAECLSDQ